MRKWTTKLNKNNSKVISIAQNLQMLPALQGRKMLKQRNNDQYKPETTDKSVFRIRKYFWQLQYPKATWLRIRPDPCIPRHFYGHWTKMCQIDTLNHSIIRLFNISFCNIEIFLSKFLRIVDKILGIRILNSEKRIAGFTSGRIHCNIVKYILQFVCFNEELLPIASRPMDEPSRALMLAMRSSGAMWGRRRLQIATFFRRVCSIRLSSCGACQTKHSV